MNKTIILGLIFVLSISIVFAHGEETFADAEEIIKAATSCQSLTDEQLEEIGEYYMEQMHPGESHELMHKMMGLEEGSEAEEQFHINMAKRLYCNEDIGGMMSGGMMNMMGNNNMMGFGGMGMMNLGMMNNWGYSSGYWSFVNVLYVIFLIGLVVLVYLWIIKLWREFYGKKK